MRSTSEQQTDTLKSKLEILIQNIHSGLLSRKDTPKQIGQFNPKVSTCWATAVYIKAGIPGLGTESLYNFKIMCITSVSLVKL